MIHMNHNNDKQFKFFQSENNSIHRIEMIEM